MSHPPNTVKFGTTGVLLLGVDDDGTEEKVSFFRKHLGSFSKTTK